VSIYRGGHHPCLAPRAAQLFRQGGAASVEAANRDDLNRCGLLFWFEMCSFFALPTFLRSPLLCSYMDLIRLPNNDRLVARLCLEDSAMLRALAHYQQTTVRTLSPGVRISIARHVHGEWFSLTPYLTCSGDDDERGRLIAALADFVRPRSYTPRETIVLAGSAATE
jgi:hypothetical protein